MPDINKISVDGIVYDIEDSRSAQRLDDVEDINNAQNMRLDNLEAAADGYLYREQIDNVISYKKAVPASALPWASFDMIGGKTLVWNQLLDSGHTSMGTTSNGVTWNVNDDGTVTANGTATAVSAFTIWRDGRDVGFKATAGHVYVSNFGVGADAGAETYYARIIGNAGNGMSNNYGVPTQHVANNDAGSGIVLRVQAGYTANNIVFKPQLFDLTAMFGEGKEPTLEQFMAMFSADYYPYKEPALRTFSPKMVASKGRNLWDEQAEVGMISDTTGLPVDGASYLRTKNFIPVTPNTTIPTTIPTAAAGRVYFYGHNKEYLSYTYTGRAVETPNDCWYLKFRFGIGYGTSYHHDISIGTEEYVPYFCNDIDLSAIVQKYFPEGMRSAGDAHDSIEVDEDGKAWAVQRIGSVDLGTLAWLSNAEYGMFYAGCENKTNSSNYPHVMASAYSASSKVASNLQNSSDSTEAGEIIGSFGTSRPYIYIKTDSKPAGLAYYELAEPIRTEIAENIPRDINVEGGGSLTFVNDHDDGYRVPLPNQETYLVKLPGGDA